MKYWKVVLALLMAVGSFFALFDGKFIDALIGIVVAFSIFVWSKKDKNRPSNQTLSVSLNKSGEKTNKNDTYVREFKVAGVTSENDDGSSRQSILKSIYDKQPPFDRSQAVMLKKYDYNGEPAFAVIINGYQIGSLHTEDVATLVKADGRVQGVSDIYVGFFNPGIDTRLEHYDNNSIFYAKIKVEIVPRRVNQNI